MTIPAQNTPFPWVNRLIDAINQEFRNVFKKPVPLPEYTVAGVPDAASFKGCKIIVTNESGGYVDAFSDGVAWRRSTDRAIIT